MLSFRACRQLVRATSRSSNPRLIFHKERVPMLKTSIPSPVIFRGAQTHFGFETVDEQEKAAKVKEVFVDVSEKYDLMNDVMSAGIHRLWKDAFIQRLAPVQGTKLLDVAGGTGDIAFRYIDALKNSRSRKPSTRTSQVTILDINQAMLDVGKSRAQKMNYESDENISIDWVCGDAEDLKLPDDNFSAYTIAFGIRNCTHIDKVLNEAYRVLEPGGRFMCLEFSKLEYEAMQSLYDLYSFNVIPAMGSIFAGKWKPYQYLVESIRKFPDQETFKEMIENAGFRHVHYENLTFGVCSIHSGFKL